MKSDTPETDAYIGDGNDDNMTEGEIAMCEFARKMERERNEEMGFRGQWSDIARRHESELVLLHGLLRNIPAGMNHYCVGESGAGEWSCRSEDVPSNCHYCGEPNEALRNPGKNFELRIPNTEEMVNRFLSWKLPKTVLPYACVMDREYQHRTGTNLPSADEAREMIHHLLRVNVKCASTPAKEVQP